MDESSARIASIATTEQVTFLPSLIHSTHDHTIYPPAHCSAIACAESRGNDATIYREKRHGRNRACIDPVVGSRAGREASAMISTRAPSPITTRSEATVPARILVIEDNPITLKMVRMTLEAAGHRLSAGNGGSRGCAISTAWCATSPTKDACWSSCGPRAKSWSVPAA